MNVKETIKKLDFDIKQIDDTIDILNYLSNGNYLSINGQQTISRNLTKLWDVQHHLLALRADLIKEQNQDLSQEHTI